MDSLTAELAFLREEITDWQTIMLSIAYHDIIYDPLKQDNEEKSAALSLSRLTLLNLPRLQKQKCSNHILATKTHSVADDNDTNYFTDADLAILGADSQTYRQYSDAIRKEYEVYPDSIYKPGRKKVLMHFLLMANIYKTKYFLDKYETGARHNLSNELGEFQ